MSINLTTSLKELSGIGDAYTKRLADIGLKTVKDLVYYFPHRYEDLSRVSSISQLQEGEKVTIQGIVSAMKTRRGWGRQRFITQGTVEDETGAIHASWFNQPYLTKTFTSGARVALAGKVTADKKGKLSFISPEIELSKDMMLHTSRLVPIYSETQGLSSKWLRWKIHTILLQLVPVWEEYLPDYMLRAHGFLGLKEAIQRVHFPSSIVEAKKTYERFAFSELLIMRLCVLAQKEKQRKKGAPAIPFDMPFVQALVKSLGVILTQDQRRAAWDVFKDLAKPYPMQRLLEGDVGTGKTFVALLASALVAKKGMQAVLMAPTEILAHQHFATFIKFLASFSLAVGLITRSKVRYYDPLVSHVRDIPLSVAKKKAREGELCIIIGTHRILPSLDKDASLTFCNLALVIIDEQHRFGVAQRAILLKSEEETSLPPIPHLLTMSATPIPRSLALTLYGGLDISVLREFPQGARVITTRIIPPAKQKSALEFIRKKIASGAQAYFIYPIIEESELLDAKAAQEEYERLKKDVFPEFRVGLLHGRMKAQDKESVMREFLEGDIKILVATSVVEVGIDVAHASIMVIEGAERFGLAQAHQLRGRIGRRGQVGYCFLFPSSFGEATKKRLQALKESNDGFFLAQKDLEIRGPGQLLGSKQAGIPDVAMHALQNPLLVEAACNAADELWAKNPSLSETPLLKKEVAHYGKTIHLE